MGTKGVARGKYNGDLDPAVRQRMSDTQKRIWADPVRRAERLEQMKIGLAKHRRSEGRRERVLSQYKDIPFVQLRSTAAGDVLASIPRDPMEYFIFDEPRTEEDYGEA